MSFPEFYPGEIIGVDVFLERFQTRTYVGVLKKERGQFIFSYDAHYLRMPNILPLGPELPLTRQQFFSRDLFPSFLDRLPDPHNPAYAQHCTHVGIAVTTTDPLILLAKFKRGPSSFVFAPVYKNKYTHKDIAELQKTLGLSMQDFAYLFDISLSALQKIKSGSSSGKEVLRLLELYLKVPEALELQLQQNAKRLHPEKVERVWVYLEEKKRLSTFWKKLSDKECKYTQECIQQLQSCSWAKNLIEKINKERLMPSSMPILFEIRFAYALYKTGLSIQNAYQAGTKNSEIKDSDVDFLITKTDGTKWLIELASLDESEEVRENTVVEGNFQFDKSTDLFKDYRRAQRALFGKIAKLDKKDQSVAIPTKFLSPQKDQYHIIILDMRGFSIGGMDLDQHDYTEMIEGKIVSSLQQPQEFMLYGIFDLRHPDPRAKYLRERIHGVGVIREKDYVDGEIQQILELFPNPNFLDKNTLIEFFPLTKKPYPSP